MKRCFFNFLVFLFSVAILSCSPIFKNNGKALEGIIYITGNEPFTRVALETDSGDTFILKVDDAMEKDLRNLQGDRVRLKYDQVTQEGANRVVRVTEYHHLKILKEKRDD